MKQTYWKTALMGAVCGLMLATVAAAQDQLPDEIAISDPLTVKAGEDVRIAIFNPNEVPVSIRVFAHSPMEDTVDESEDIVIAAGKLRFFDMKTVKEFIGIMGFRMSPASGRNTVLLTDVLVTGIKGSVQHRGPGGQSQTLGLNPYRVRGGTLSKPGGKMAVSSVWVIGPAN
ncbi:MAG: hypothetical protein HY820_39615 [Acidobacteria bacterium]|nr:hypothetical protein [Acidobacteriota bacterium]